MNDKFENQKEQLISIKHEISLLYQQINYLLRNEKPLELLDLDVLMNRTHTLYDQLCAINLGVEPDDEDLPFDAEAFSGLFGGMTQEEPEPTPEEETPTEQQEETPAEEETFVEEEAPAEEEQPEALPEETPVEVKEETVVETVEEVSAEPVEETTDNEEETDEEKQTELPLGDEYGFFFRFESVPENEVEEKKEEPTKTEEPVQMEEPVVEEEKELKFETVEKDGKVIHIMEEISEEDIPERDRIHGDDLVQDNPFEMPKMEVENLVDQELEKERQTSETVVDFFGHDDEEFELSSPETLGDKMMHEDNSLAAKLQQNPVRDLKSVIGINDKFLFVNELFGGSMEKYNKSIENLNDLKTLNGAMIYLNELKIELQWNSSNEAYQKLKDLVSRKFES
jgi:hypothetical protein